MGATDDLVLRGRGNGIPETVMAVVVAAPPSIVAIGVTRRPETHLSTVMVVVVVLLLLAPAVVLALRGVVRLVIGDAVLERRHRGGWSGRLRTADVAEVVTVSSFVFGRAQVVPVVFLLDRNGRTLQQVSGQFFDRKALAELVLRFPWARTSIIEEPVTARRLHRLRPGLIGWPQRHQVTTGVLLGMLTIAVVVTVLSVS